MQLLYLSNYSRFPSRFCTSVRIPLEDTLFYYRLVLFLHRLTRSVRWCCPLGNHVILYLLWLFSSLDSIATVKIVVCSLISFFINSTFVLIPCVNIDVSGLSCNLVFTILFQFIWKLSFFSSFFFFFFFEYVLHDLPVHIFLVSLLGIRPNKKYIKVIPPEG